jgi:hypothetical protein
MSGSVFTDFNATNGFNDATTGVLLPSWVFNTALSLHPTPDLSILNEFFQSQAGISVLFENFHLHLIMLPGTYLACY